MGANSGSRIKEKYVLRTETGYRVGEYKFGNADSANVFSWLFLNYSPSIATQVMESVKSKLGNLGIPDILGVVDIGPEGVSLVGTIINAVVMAAGYGYEMGQVSAQSANKCNLYSPNADQDGYVRFLIGSWAKDPDYGPWYRTLSKMYCKG